MTREREDSFVLSARGLGLGGGWSPIFEFEDILIQSGQARLLTVERRGGAGRGLNSKLVRRTVGPYRLVAGEGPVQGRVLLVVAPMPKHFEMVRAIPRWRRRFDVVALFLVDSARPLMHLRLLRQVDHIFVPIAESRDPIHAATGVATSILPFGADVLTHGSDSLARPIDVVAYGRQPIDLTSALKLRFNRPGNGRWFMHSPFGYQEPSTRSEDRLLFWKLLRSSKLALNFDTSVQGRRPWVHDTSIVTPRWFECLAAGCVTVGLPPQTPLAEQLFDWPDAMIRLTGSMQDQLIQIDALLDDEPRLAAATRRNYRHMLARHDWRHRIADMWDRLGLARPQRLQQELATLQERSYGG